MKRRFILNPLLALVPMVIVALAAACGGGNKDSMPNAGDSDEGKPEAEAASTNTPVPATPVSSSPKVTPTRGTESVRADVVATIELGGSDTISLAVDPDRNRIYAADFYEGRLSMIDGGTGAVVDAIALGMPPEDVAVNPATGRVYVLSLDTLVVVDGASLEILSTIEVCGHAAANSITAVEVDPVNNRVYVAHDTCRALFVIDGTTDQVVGSVAIDGLAWIRGLAVNPATDSVYVAAGSRIYAVDVAANAVVATVSREGFTEGVAVDPISNRIYVAHESDSFSIDDATHVVSVLGSRIDAKWVGADPLANRIYFVCSSGIRGWAVDSTGEARQFQIDVDAGPVGISDMALDPATSRLYLTNGWTVWVVQLD